MAIKKIPWHRLIKFAIVGGSSFVIDFGFYFVFTRFAHIPYIASRTMSIALAFIWNFLLNRQWTFQARSGKMSHQAARFLVVMTITSFLNLLLMRLGVSRWHLNDLLVLVVVSILIMGINFTAHHLWSYATDSSKPNR